MISCIRQFLCQKKSEICEECSQLTHTKNAMIKKTFKFLIKNTETEGKNDLEK